MTNDKIDLAKEHHDAFMDREQTVEGFDEAIKRIYPLLPIEPCSICRGTGWVNHSHANECSVCGGTGKQNHKGAEGVAYNL
jgi:RecJ-like exonuclease